MIRRSLIWKNGSENWKKRYWPTRPTLQKLNGLMAEKEEAEAALEVKMDRWVYLTELAEKIEAEKNK